MDCVLYNGNLLTQAAAQPRAQALAIHEGRIAAVGDDRSIRSLATPTTQLIDLYGQTVVPGFEDAHAHVWKIGHLLTSMVDLRGCGSFTDLADLLSNRARSLPEGAWLQARGFNEARLREGTRPTRHDLDRWVPDRPVLVTRTCGHVFVANTLALQKAAIDRATPVPGGGVIERDASGEPNGILHETAAGLVQRILPEPSPVEYEAMILAALQHQTALGITSSSDCGVMPALLDAYLALERRGSLPVRMVVMPLGRPDSDHHPMRLPPQYRSDFLRVDTVKFLADGGLSGATAALTTPYTGSSSRGVLRFATDELRALFLHAQCAGWRIATHAIGDAAIEQVLSLYEELGPPILGHRIEHFGIPTKTQLARAAAIAAVSVTQAIFLRELGRNFLNVVPLELRAQLYPFRDMLAAGLTVALSSDAPVVEDDNPLTGMHAAVTRSTREGNILSPEQAITADQALRCYTREGAAAAGESATRGTLQTGRFADLAILSEDPTKVPANALLDIRVQRTLVAGKTVYQA